jgi:lysozyme family protein
MLSFQRLKDGYERNWGALQIRPDRREEASQEAVRLQKGKTVYQAVESKTGVPWWFVGLCHYRESCFNFNTYLGNGQVLSRETTIVPRGRGPFTGPDAFVDGAVDALRLEAFAAATDWSIARALYRLEGFNGFGYQTKGVNSPYLYGGSNLYGPPEARAGKFVADHLFDPSVVDTQLGTAVLLKALLEFDQTVKFDETSSKVSISPEPDETLAQNTLLVQQSLNKLGVDPYLTEDGKSGPRTKEAISQFQRQNGLPDTGIADANTFATLIQKSSTLPHADKLQAPVDLLRQIIQQAADQQSANPSAKSTPLPADLATLAKDIQKVVPASQQAQLPDLSRTEQLVEALLTTVLSRQQQAANGPSPSDEITRFLKMLAEAKTAGVAAPTSPDADQVLQTLLRVAAAAAAADGKIPSPPSASVGSAAQVLQALPAILSAGSNLATGSTSAATSATVASNVLLSPIDSMLGGQALAGKKTALAVVAYAALSIFQSLGVVGNATGADASTTGQVLTTLIGAFGALGGLAKIDRIVRALAVIAVK